MTDLAAYAPQLLAVFMDATMLSSGGSGVVPPYLEPGHDNYHYTVHTAETGGTARGTVDFACGNITGLFLEIAQAAGPGRMQQRMQDNIALIEMLEQHGPLTIADPYAQLGQGHVINTLRNYMANGHSEESARVQMAQQPQVQEQVRQADPAYQREQAQREGRPYLASVTIACGR